MRGVNVYPTATFDPAKSSPLQYMTAPAKMCNKTSSIISLPACWSTNNISATLEKCLDKVIQMSLRCEQNSWKNGQNREEIWYDIRRT